MRAGQNLVQKVPICFEGPPGIANRDLVIRQGAKHHLRFIAQDDLGPRIILSRSKQRECRFNAPSRLAGAPQAVQGIGRTQGGVSPEERVPERMIGGAE